MTRTVQMLSLLLATGLSTAITWKLLEPRGTGLPEFVHVEEGRVLEHPWFEEVAAEVGLTASHVATLGRHSWFPEIMGGGAGFLDYDGDGDLDLYVVQSGDLESGNQVPGNRLYRNDDGRFTDVSVAAGVADTRYGMGCTCGDYDGDRDVDIYVTNFDRDVLYRNNGDGTFTDVTDEAGLGNELWGMSAAFVDIDRDGDLDLFVTNYVLWSQETEIDCRGPLGKRDYCSPLSFAAPAPDVLYRNRGDGTFEDATAAAGIDRAYGNGLGVVCADLDDDGWIDIYVANDGSPNQLWISQHDGTFVDEAIAMGCAVNEQGASEASMGVAAFDLEDDGDLDLLLTHMRGETSTCYISEDGLFEDGTATLGLGRLGFPYTGFGIITADLDLDGDLDIYVANGDVIRPATHLDYEDRYAQPDQLFVGVAPGRFEEARASDGTASPALTTSRAAAAADYDGDGDLDLLVVDRGRPPRLLRNVAGGGRAWIQLRLVDRHGGLALGARAGLRAGSRTTWRLALRASSYLASGDPRIHAGLGTAQQVDEVTVRWLSGLAETFGPLAAGREHELREGTGTKIDGPR